MSSIHMTFWEQPTYGQRLAVVMPYDQRFVERMKIDLQPPITRIWVPPIKAWFLDAGHRERFMELAMEAMGRFGSPFCAGCLAATNDGKKSGCPSWRGRMGRSWDADYLATWGEPADRDEIAGPPPRVTIEQPLPAQVTLDDLFKPLPPAAMTIDLQPPVAATTLDLQKPALTYLERMAGVRPKFDPQALQRPPWEPPAKSVADVRPFCFGGTVPRLDGGKGYSRGAGMCSVCPYATPCNEATEALKPPEVREAEALERRLEAAAQEKRRQELLEAEVRRRELDRERKERIESARAERERAATRRALEEEEERLERIQEANERKRAELEREEKLSALKAKQAARREAREDAKKPRATVDDALNVLGLGQPGKRKLGK